MTATLAAARRDPPAWTLAPLPVSPDPAAARAFCRAVAARHYENFTVATLLAPAPLRQHLANVHTFARWADDLADEAESPTAALAALDGWRRELDRSFAGRSSHPVFIALGETIRAADLSVEPFADLIDAFRQDQVTTRYATRADLVAYCRRSADPVGRIVLALGGCRDAELDAGAQATSEYGRRQDEHDGQQQAGGEQLEHGPQRDGPATCRRPDVRLLGG